MPRSFAAALLALLACAFPALAAIESETDKATRMILCDCGCPPQAVHDCACSHAADVRREIAAEVASGKSGQQVIDAYVARYGEKIRIAPTASGFNLLAWLLPAIALVSASLFAVLVLRRWKRSPGAVAEAASPASAPSPADEAYVRRIARQLEERS